MPSELSKFARHVVARRAVRCRVLIAEGRMIDWLRRMFRITAPCADPAIAARAERLFEEQFVANARRTDRMFIGLMIVQCLFAIVAAMVTSPWTYEGGVRHVHPHVWMALGTGGGLAGLAIYCACVAPGTTFTRYLIAVVQMLFSALLIQITGGRLETHFHIFGSLAFLAFYRDWKVLVPATLIVAADHFLRGIWFPASIFGVAEVGPWRWCEHVGWVLFEDVFLAISCVQASRGMWNSSVTMAWLEERNTDLKHRTEEREEAFRLKRAVIENALDAVVSTDENCVIVDWNSQATATFGWTADEAIGQNLSELVIPVASREAHRQGLQRFQNTGIANILNKRIEVPAIDKTGREFPVELAITPICDGQRRTFCAFARDITDRVQTAESLRKDRDEAKAASRAKSTFLAHISHEIRTPLNGILGYADLMLRKDASLSATDRHEYLHTVRDSGKHLLDLINDILDISKIEAGQIDSERLLCSPHEIIAQVVSVLRVRAQEKGLELDYAWDGKIPEFIVSDPQRLRQLLMNLVGNAIKFTTQGQVQVVARLRSVEGRYVFELEVHDTGPGIASENQQRIFEPFVQADDSVTREFGGTGLGLAICRRIVHMLGGTLSLSSEPGKGSVFTASLDPGRLEGVRILDTVASDIVRPVKAAPNETIHLAPCRVLVVEDGTANRKLLEIVLEDAGATVITAENGETGVALALAARETGDLFDVILMDMQMPVLDGYTAARQLREHDLKTPIFALTAHAMKGDEMVCREAGCSAYLTKPIDTMKLLAAVSGVVGTSAPPRKRETVKIAVEHQPTVNPDLEDIAYLFLDELPGRMRELTTARETQDLSIIAHTAHWLKGSAGMFGFDMFTNPAMILEKTARADDFAQCEQLIDEISALVESLNLDAAPQTAAVAPESTVAAAAEPHPVANEIVPDQTPGIVPVDTTLQSSKILIVDDESLNLVAMTALLKQIGYTNTVTVQKPQLALQAILVERPDLVLLDLHMPVMNGFEVLEMIRHTPGFEHLPVVMVTASRDKEHRQRALQLGVTDFLAKPIDCAELAPRVRNALTVKYHEDHLRNYAQALESQVRERTAQLDRARRNAVYCLARAAEFRDDETGRHVVRVGRYSGIIARGIGWTADAIKMLEEAAQLHDVGKIGVPDNILLKPGKLSPDEYAMMQKHCGFGKSIFECFTEDDWYAVRRHAEIGNKILSVEDAPLMEMASIIALTHHEKFDGSGYPLGLKGTDIPLVGRIVAIADVFDALSSKRIYKPAFPVEQCFEILEQGRGKHFDPALLDAFVAARDEVLSVQIAHADVT
jgi:two-component system sensor histidine kinase/response regulator